MSDFTHAAGENDALVIIDVQNDFLSGGALAVPDGDAILPGVEQLAGQFENVILTQDWHPSGHASFAATHPGKAPFEVIEMPYGPQVLWPTHCVAGSAGAEFRLPTSVLEKAQMVVRKGFRAQIDSYSAFLENDQKTPTGLAGALRERGIERVVLCGLALDYCVGFSALDGRKLGFEVTVVQGATRGIAPESIAERLGQMRDAGVLVV